MIELSAVSKWFGSVVAVSDVSFSVGTGVTALLGPNGAGKSTVMRMMAGLARPSSGTVRVLGADPRRDLGVLARVGLAPQQEATFDRLRPVEMVEAAARLSKVPRARGAAGVALEQVGMDPSEPRPISSLSKGNKQKVKLACAMVHDPDVLVLDEPLNGLDPRQRLHVIEIVRAFGARDGKCCVVSSHVLDEVERFGSRILVIAQGRLAAEGEFRAIRDLMDDRPHRIRLRATDVRRLAALLVGEGLAVGVHVAAIEGIDQVVAEVVDVHRFRAAVAPLAERSGLVLHEVAPLDDDLDSVFRYLVGRG
jgi:ABC-2 type transport system ATP-binding protein